MSLRIASILLVAALTLMTAPFPGAPVAEAGAPDSPAEASHGSLDPVRISLSSTAQPTIGDAMTVTASLTPQWQTLGDAQDFILEVRGGAGLLLPEPQIVNLSSEPVAVEFQVTPLAAGDHLIIVEAHLANEASDGELGGVRRGWISIQDESSAFFEDAIPPKDYAEYVEVISETSSSSRRAATPLLGEASPEPVYVYSPAMPPGRTSGEAGDKDASPQPVASKSSPEPTMQFNAQGNATGASYDPLNEAKGGDEGAQVAALVTNLVFSDNFNDNYLSPSLWSVLDSGSGVAETNGRLETTVTEVYSPQVIVQSATIPATFSSSKGVDASVDMSKDINGPGWAGSIEMRIVRSDDSSKYVTIKYSDWNGKVYLQDSNGGSTILASPGQMMRGYHDYRLEIDSNSYKGTFDGTSTTISSSIFAGATGVNVRMVDKAATGTPGAWETAARDNVEVYTFDTAPSTFTASICWNFRDEGYGDPANSLGAQPQRWATIEVWDEDDGITDDLLASGITDSNGCFTSGPIPRDESDCCFRGTQDVYLKIALCNSATCVSRPTILHPIAGEPYKWLTVTNTVGSATHLDFGSVLVPSSGADGARVFQHLNNGWAWAQGYGMTEVTSRQSNAVIPCPTEDWIFFDCAGEGWYALPYGKGQVLPADTMYYSSELGVAPDIILHEWGHYVMDRAYNNWWPTTNPYVSHGFCASTSQVIAWQEGFAQFIGARVNREYAGAPGVDRDYSDNYYSRDYKGSSFHYNMESGTSRCAASGGDFVEGHIARTLWDLADSENDYLDVFAPGMNGIWRVLNACNDASFQDFYSGGSCTWSNQGESKCAFVRAAYQKDPEAYIDYNTAPSASMFTQTSYGWYRGTIYLGASISDPESCSVGISGEFRISSNSVCSASDALVGTDDTASYFIGFDSTTVPDDASVWTCIQASDSMEESAWVASPSSIGIDNTPPVTSASRTCGVSGNSGWCRGTSATTSFSAYDALSGLSSQSCTLASVSISCGSQSHTFQGSRVAKIVAYDVAGNQGTSQVDVKIDGVAPSISVSVPIVGLLEYDVTWTASDYNSGLTGSIAIEETNTLLGTTSTVCTDQVTTGQSYESDSCARGTLTAPLLPGQYCYRARVSDVAGNSATSADACIIKV